ncbi:propionyl-CoA carboxylase [Ramlibacter sp. G-1-2-2]|uniref:Propionyl-CoA carboxylase n=1 Tax=Ramlibacter agri TaxID=2728837 RepID=A0A848GYY4_9BURK|nr:carboxyl transferase domain-containing protein [Ramlibacter agri]NML43377.1 propionyl-CoA carboxylase [Ramlibacter agri]
MKPDPQSAPPATHPAAAELDVRRAAALQMGGPEGLAKQASLGKLTARERIDRLLDAGSFSEMGMLAGKGRYDEHGAFVSFSPANAVMGAGQVQGRRVVVSADDFTIRGGSSESTVSDKWIYAERYAHQMRLPLVRLVETAGGSIRILEQNQSTKIPGYPSWPWMPLLAQSPVVGVALGACAGLGAIKVGMSHFSVMVKGMAQLFAGGPPVVQRGIGEEIHKEDLGGAAVHTRLSGIVTNAAESEDDAFAQVRRFLSFMPANVWSVPERAARADDPRRADEWLDQAIPLDTRKVFDVRKILKSVFDQDSLFELGRGFGASTLTMLGRLDGCAVGILANDPRVMGGALTSQAARKLERFVDVCDTFHLPIVNFVDQPGVMFGSEAEKAGTLGAAIGAVAAIEQSRVPWCAIILRRSFGVGGQMHGPQHGPDGYALLHRFAWPTARWGSIPVEGGVAAAYKRELAEAGDPRERQDELEAYYQQLSSPFRTAERFGVIDVIKPRETRALLCDWVQDAYGVTQGQTGIRTRTFR